WRQDLDCFLRCILLVNCSGYRRLYSRRRNSTGESRRTSRSEDVGEMLIESNPLLEATSFGREREVRKHVGDYTLFVTGLFPESVARASRGNRPQLRTQRGGIMATGTVIYKCSREKRRIGRPNLVQNFCKQVTHLGLAFGLRLGKPAGRQRRHHGHARPPRAPRPRACHRSIITEVPPIYTLHLTFFTKKKLFARSEEHTSELQSRGHLVCRLLLEKKK